MDIEDNERILRTIRGALGVIGDLIYMPVVDASAVAVCCINLCIPLCIELSFVPHEAKRGFERKILATAGMLLLSLDRDEYTPEFLQAGMHGNFFDIILGETGGGFLASVLRTIRSLGLNNHEIYRKILSRVFNDVLLHPSVDSPTVKEFLPMVQGLPSDVRSLPRTREVLQPVAGSIVLKGEDVRNQARIIFNNQTEKDWRLAIIEVLSRDSLWQLGSMVTEIIVHSIGPYEESHYPLSDNRKYVKGLIEVGKMIGLDLRFSVQLTVDPNSPHLALARRVALFIAASPPVAIGLPSYGEERGVVHPAARAVDALLTYFYSGYDDVPHGFTHSTNAYVKFTDEGIRTEWYLKPTLEASGGTELLQPDSKINVAHVWA